MLKLLLSALLTLGASALAQDMTLGIGTGGQECGGNIYYVNSLTGNDSNCGNNIRQPWKTIAKVNSASPGAPVGTTVSFAGGQTFTTTTSLTVPNDNFTINSYGTGKATISTGNSAACIGNVNHANTTISNINCLGGGNATNTQDGIVFIISSNSPIQGPLINNVEVSGYGVRCFIAVNTLNSSWKGIQITNSHFHDCTGNWQNTLGDFISGCVMIFNKIGDSAANASATITGNTVDHCQGTNDLSRRGTGIGIWVSGASGTLMSQNIVHDIGANENSDNNGGSCGLIYGNADGMVASFNEVYLVTTLDQDGEGICINPGNGGVTTVGNIAEYNYAHDNEVAEILIGDFDQAQTFNSIVRFNVTYSSNGNAASHAGAGIQVGALGGGPSMSTSGSIFNNTIISGPGGGGVGAGCVSNRGSGGKLIISYSNNICYGVGSNDARVIFDVTFAGASAIITSNDYWTDSAANPLYVSVDNNVTHFSSLATLQTSGFEKVGGNPVGTVQYPLITGLSFPAPAPVCGGYVAGCPSVAILRGASSLAQPAGANVNTLYGIAVGAQDFYGNALTASTLPIGASLATGPGFDPATTAWINTVVGAGGTVSDKQKNRVDILITGLKTDGLFGLIDRMWLFASENTQQALTDIIGTHTATNVGGLVFTAKRGYTPTTSSAQYIESSFNPTTATAPHFVQNSCTIGAWLFAIPTPPSTTNNNPWGIQTNVNSYNQILPQNMFSGGQLAFMNCNSFPATSGIASQSTTGLYLTSRTGASVRLDYINGTQVASPNDASAAVENGSFRAGAGADVSNIISIVEVGGGMTTTQATSFYSRLNTYMGSL